jgi:hypothetical protein
MVGWKSGIGEVRLAVEDEAGEAAAWRVEDEPKAGLRRWGDGVVVIVKVSSMKPSSLCALSGARRPFDMIFEMIAPISATSSSLRATASVLEPVMGSPKTSLSEEPSSAMDVDPVVESRAGGVESFRIAGGEETGDAD